MRQVERNRTIEGIYPVAKLARLSEAMFSSEGFVTAKLEFGRCLGFSCLKGEVSASIMAECQRCLQPIKTDLVGKFKFALLSSEEDFDLLPDELEPYLIEGDEQSVVDLIEDELLLSLPMVIIHKKPCSDFMNEHEALLKAEKEAMHPFAALKNLKGSLKN
ncbi:MAG: DUF177 domain-containing protein [Gammaproteobacteria bacterium]|nr:DUF177 domain-containing protein [Gammaproteobacteria bacterium]